jgi:uncharacterized damage-inducible protein DinB
MSMIQPLLGELEQEAATIRRHFEVLPESKLKWKPHAKSMTLGQLALHIAQMPGSIAELAQLDSVPAPEFPPATQPKTRAEILEMLNTSVAKAMKLLAPMTDQQMMSEWKAVRDGKAIFTVPKVALIRAILLNHVYHHRGQLSVYLRLLDVKVPATYGNSADENPFK